MWLTTWEERANTFIAPMVGLPTLPVVGPQPFREKHGWWKFALAQELYARDPKPFVWIDDDLAYERRAYEWCNGGDGLAIAPHTYQGLTLTQLQAIRTFVDAHG